MGELKTKGIGYVSQSVDFIDGGSAWESNPPNEVLARCTGFEVRELICNFNKLLYTGLKSD